MTLQVNPWYVINLEDFLFYCCPECDSKSKDSQDFINHALLHEQAKETLVNLHLIPKPEEIKTEVEEDQDIKYEVKYDDADDPDYEMEEPDDDYEDPDYVDRKVKKYDQTNERVKDIGLIERIILYNLHGYIER